MIIRRKHNSNYTIVPNLVLNDEALTYEAIGLLCYLLSKPDNWQVQVDQICKARRKDRSVGKDKAYKLIGLLCDAGYIAKKQVRNPETKTFIAHEYVVFDEPFPENTEVGKSACEDEPLPEKPEPEKPDTANQDHSKYCKVVSTEKDNPLSGETGKTNQTSPSKPKRRISYTPEFEGFWKAYPTSANMSKMIAFNEWQRLDAADRQAATEALPAFRRDLAKEDWRRPVYADRYLKQRRFDGYTDSTNDIDWAKCCKVAIQSRQWSRVFGPPPGQLDCKVPPELVTPELLAAVQGRRVAA